MRAAEYAALLSWCWLVKLYCDVAVDIVKDHAAWQNTRSLTS